LIKLSELIMLGCYVGDAMHCVPRCKIGAIPFALVGVVTSKPGGRNH